MTLLDTCREWLAAQTEPEREAIRAEVRAAIAPAPPPSADPDRAAFDAAIAKASAAETEDAAREAFATVTIPPPGPDRPEGEPMAEGGDDWTPRPPEREWLIPAWLPAGRVVMLTGPGKVGKSRLALQLAAALAAGDSEWLAGGPRLAARNPAVAVLATWEDERDEVARRLHAMKAAGAVGDRLRYVHPAGAIWTAPTGNPSAVGEVSAAGEHLRRYCEAKAARVLIVDPRAAAFALNENDRSAVRAFMASWDGWAREVGCAVLLIAHPPKSDAPYSGSTDWHAAARAVWELSDKETPNKGPPAIRLACTAASYAKMPAPLWLAGYPRWSAVSTALAAEDLARVRGEGEGDADAAARAYADASGKGNPYG